MAKIKHKETRRDLEEDIFANFGQKAWKWLQDHQNAVFVVLCVIAVLYISTALIRRYRENVTSQANFAITQARSDFYQALTSADENAKAQRMEESERKLNQVITEFSGSPVGHRALYLSAVFQFRQMAYDKARAKFAQYEREATDNEDRARGVLGEGACYENEAFVKGDNALLEKALASYKQAADMAGANYVKYQAMLAEAHVLGRDPQKRAEAVALLEEVIKGRQAALDEANPKPTDTKEKDTTQARPELDALDGATLVDEAKTELEKIKALL